MSIVARRLIRLGLLPALLLSGAGRADTPPVIDCPWYSPTTVDNFATRGFYVPSYPGTSLKTVTLYLHPSTLGSYLLVLTARLSTYSGTLVGTASVQTTFSSSAPVPVVFNFGNIGVSPGAEVTFNGSATGPGTVLMELATSAACVMLETEGTDSPLSTYRRQGVAVRITGDLPSTFPHSVTFPANASIHGVNSTFFHTDLWLYNFDLATVNVSATYYCYVGQSCASAPQSFSIESGQGKTFSDVVASLFGAPETAGAIVLRYSSESSTNTLKALARTYTPSLPGPTTGSAMPGLLFTAASGKTTFVGLGNNGGDRSAGFRTNTGAFNSFGYPATVTFQLTTMSGVSLGSVTQTWEAHEARQINDVFAAAGAGSVVTTDAILTVTSDIPVFPYVTVVDNQTGDSVIQ